MTYKEFFSKKRIAVIGLGPHGEMIPDIRFLLRNRADVFLYDMRSERKLKSSISELKEDGLEKYSIGKIDGDDLLNFDLILLSPEISKKSLFLKKAISAEIQIEFPDTLFFKLSPQVTLIGILGMYGKSTVATMIYGALKKSFANIKDQGLFFIDPDSNHGALSHLKKIKKGDVVLARIPESLIPYYHEIHISPHVAVITSSIPFPILDFQTYNNFIIAPDEVVDDIKSQNTLFSKAKILRTRASSIPEDFGPVGRYKHDRENIALVLQTCELFKVSTEIVKQVVTNFSGSRGCIEFVKKVEGVEFYNDANSINPGSTLSALRSISVNKNTVLILGGAYTGHDYSNLIKNITQYTSTIVLISGSGSLGIRTDIEKLDDIKLIQTHSLEDAVKEAYKYAKKGGKVLFSPAFDAVGVDISRKDRGEKFVKIVRSL